jgi:molybdate-binding protein/DNA-binding XRE family transcriptional regulator
LNHPGNKFPDSFPTVNSTFAMTKPTPAASKSEDTMSRVRRLREVRGLSQIELAAAVGLTRQSVHSIESGRSIPAVDVALRLANILDCSVESLFGETATGAQLTAEPVTESKTCRVALAHIAGKWFSYPLERTKVGCSADALVVRRTQGKVAVDVLRSTAEARENIVLMGCAPALGLLCDRLNSSTGPGRFLWIGQSSTTALTALNTQRTHVAGVHLVDARTGEANVPDVRKHTPKVPVVLVTLARWEVGIVASTRVQGRVKNVSHLGRRGIRLVTREPGSGARRLLERELKQSGVSVDVVKQARVMVHGHLEVAEAIALGAGDAGIATRDAAMAFDLDFTPLSEERFDLVVPRDDMNDPRLARMFDVMTSAPLRRELSSLGYDVTACGDRVAEISEA